MPRKPKADATPPPPAKVDPIQAAIDALHSAAAAGNFKAIKALTDGTLDRLLAKQGGTSCERREIVRGQVRTHCPNCSHKLLVSYDTEQGFASLHVGDLTTGLDRENPLTQEVEVRIDP